jgi:RimJ/RimL family protein N-acetyltransferase
VAVADVHEEGGMFDKSILKDVPEEIWSERLQLRVPRTGDGPLCNEAVCESHLELKPWMPWASGDEPPTVEESEAFCRSAAARFLLREDISYLVFVVETGKFVGSAGLHRFDWSVPKFEIGYWCRTSLLGKGYATEVTRALTDLAFNTLGAERVEVLCDNRNTKSAGVAERAGYVLESIRISDSRGVKGELRDTRVYVKTRRKT